MSRKIANKQLVKHLVQYGYTLIMHTIGLWQHKTRTTLFTLVDNDFGVKYIKCNDAKHFKNSIKVLYKYIKIKDIY